MECDLRTAAAADLERVWEFRRELYIHDLGAISEDRDRASLRELLSRPELGMILMAIAGGAVAGYVIVTFGFSVEFAGRFGLIDELYVDHSFRGKGFGSAILAAVEKMVVTRAVTALRLEVERSNVDAERLYRRIGFEPHDRHLMTKWISRPAKP